jgi:hypothetical protein
MYRSLMENPAIIIFRIDNKFVGPFVMPSFFLMWLAGLRSHAWSPESSESRDGASDRRESGLHAQILLSQFAHHVLYQKK